MYKFNGNDYELIKNVKDGFDFEEVQSKLSDFYDKYDYVFGDWAYGKLRLKGFYDSESKEVKDYNDIKNLDKHLEENCAFECKHFLIKKDNIVE